MCRNIKTLFNFYRSREDEIARARARAAQRFAGWGKERRAEER